MGKLERCPRLLEAVQAGLSEGCSPEQIAARLPVGHPDDMEMRISPETIYQSVFVQARGELRRQLKAICAGRTRRRERGAPERRGRVVKSPTWDQGRELAAHKPFSEQTGIQVYVCDPHSPWQRGSNENTNGLLRQYLPKGSGLAPRSQVELDKIAAQLNRPSPKDPRLDDAGREGGRAARPGGRTQDQLKRPSPRRLALRARLRNKGRSSESGRPNANYKHPVSR